MSKKEKELYQYKKVNIDELVPYVNNARTHPAEQIKQIQASLREFGFVNPILIDAEKTIIAGHGRYEAAKKEGYKEVPCVFVDDLTEAQKKAYILADNRLAETSDWDEETLRAELEFLNGEDIDISFLDFPEAETEDLPEEKTKTDLTETLPKSRIMVCTISTFGTDTEVFAEVQIPQEDADRFNDNFYKMDPEKIQKTLLEALNAL